MDARSHSQLSLDAARTTGLSTEGQSTGAASLESLTTSLKSLTVPWATHMKTSAIMAPRPSTAAVSSTGPGDRGEGTKSGTVADQRIRDAKGLIAGVNEPVPASPSSTSRVDQGDKMLTPDGSIVRKAPTTAGQAQPYAPFEGVVDNSLAKTTNDTDAGSAGDQAGGPDDGYGVLSRNKRAVTRTARPTGDRGSAVASSDRALPQDGEDDLGRAEQSSTDFRARRKAFTPSNSFANSFADSEANGELDSTGPPDHPVHPAVSAHSHRNYEAPLPPGWEMKLDTPSGKTFYVNHAIRAITWERPTQGMAGMPPHTNANAPGRGVHRGHEGVGNMYSNTSYADAGNWRRPTSRSASAQSPQSHMVCGRLCAF